MKTYLFPLIFSLTACESLKEIGDTGAEADPLDVDDDGDGQTENDGDCDDTNPDIYTDAEETCDGVDNNCSGDETDATDPATWYVDSDGDTYGDASTSMESCDQPSGYVDNAGDCNDAEALAWSDAVEVCDGVDNNCSGDETDVVDPPNWYADVDSDTYGDPTSSVSGCEQPSGYVGNMDDCDDSDATINPELIWYADADSDTYGDPNASTTACEQPSGYVTNTFDCNDGEPLAWTGAEDTCDNVDNNCSGDETDAIDQTTWYADGDGDGFGDANTTTDSCTMPSGYIDNLDDCDDTAANVVYCDYVIDGTVETWSAGTYQYNDLVLNNGAMLFIEEDVMILLDGNFLVDSTSWIIGDSAGHAANTVNGDGNGPCPGSWVASEAASGAGYGGLGGEGGTDSSTSIAPAGCTTGARDGVSIAMGSSGGTSDGATGGAGGASLWVNASGIYVDGVISMDGGDGLPGLSIARNSGGGAGGGILLEADIVDVQGALSALGGDGGSSVGSSVADGGGAGGGGRIKIFTPILNLAGDYFVEGGLGGEAGNYQYGQDGGLGTLYVERGACTGWEWNGACWFTSPNVGMSCNEVCADQNLIFDVSGSTHSGNDVGMHFWPNKSDGNDWVSVECSSTDNNTNWGADGSTPDGDWSYSECYVNCACY